MENPAKSWRPTKAKIQMLIILPLLDSTPTNPDVPFNITWVLSSANTGTTVNSTSNIAPLNTWFTDLETDLCILSGYWYIPSDLEGDIGCDQQARQQNQNWFKPGSGGTRL